jgi:hypothetical protein
MISRRTPPRSGPRLAAAAGLGASVGLGLAIDPTAAEPRAPAETFAVVVGWNGGNKELPPLRYADDDAVRFAHFFAGLGPAGGEARTWLLTEIDEPTRATVARAGLAATPRAAPTRDAVLGALGEVAALLRRRPARGTRVLYFVYAGHGLGGRVLLKPTAGPEAALSGAELRAALAELVAADPALRVLVFLDACRSQSLFAERGGGASGPDFGAAVGELEDRARSVSIGVLTAARTGRPAGEVKALEAGYFSHVLTSGLAGAADADGDDVVTFGELAAFVAFHTEKLTGQLPWFDPLRGDLSADAIDHRGRTARIVIPAPDHGRFLVGAAAGMPVFAEAFKAPGRSLRLALPPGRYRVRRAAGTAPAREAAFELRGDAAVDLARVAWTDVGVEPRGPLEAPGAGGGAAESIGDLMEFSAAFSPEVVSALAAGFHAGREPTGFAARARHGVILSAALGPPPLRLGGLEVGAGVRYRYRIGGPWRIGAAVRAATSAHATADEPYDLRRVVLGGEIGAIVYERSMLAVEAHAAAGWSAVLRTAPSGTTGDPASPWGDVGVRLDLWLVRGWFAALGVRLGGALVEVDGDTRLTGGPGLDVGLGLTF